MSRADRSLTGGAIAPPPSSTEYGSEGVFSETALQRGTRSIPASSIGDGGTTGGGTGTSANDATIGILAGNGLTGGGEFTTNQADNETIQIDMPVTFTPGTGQMAGTAIGTANNPIQSITVDTYGRVTNITTQSAIPEPTPFTDNFSSSEDRTPRAALETPTMEDLTLMVADGYTIGDISPVSSGSVPVTIGTPTGSGTNMVTIPVTIPANDQSSDPTGPARVTVTTTVTETASGRTQMETATPLDRNIFIPYYQMIFDTRQTSLSSLSGLTASSAALTNGTMINFTYNTGGPRRQYSYLALERVTGRTYRFDAGFFDISTDPTGMSAMMFGRTFDFYEFPTQTDLSFTIRY